MEQLSKCQEGEVASHENEGLCNQKLPPQIDGPSGKP